MEGREEGYEGSGSRTPPSHEEEEFDFIATVEKVKDKPCTVSRVEIVGNKRTKRKVIDRELESVRRAKNLEEIMKRVSESVEELNQLDIFKNVDAIIDAGPEHLPDTAVVTVTVEEKSGYGLHTGVYVQGSETTTEISGSMKNALGYAEEFDLTVTKGNLFTPKQSSGKYSLSWLDNRFLGTRSQLRSQIFRTTNSYMTFSSYSESSTGLGTDWVSPGGVHKLGYELVWRELFCGSGGGQITASKEVLQQAGHNMKSSLKHTLVLDNRRVAGSLMSKGAAVQATTEVSGIGLDPMMFRFVREEVEVVLEHPISILKSFETALELRLKAGAILPWGKGGFDKPTYIGDRFFLGGTGDLRGFWIKGAGPTGQCRGSEGAAEGVTGPSTSSEERKRDALGGDVMFSALAALNFEVPFAPALKQAGIYAHVYGNVGNCVGLGGYGKQALRSCANELKAKTRASFGAGLVWPSPIGKLEVNYCRVHRAFEHDKWRNGFHFGFSTSNLDFEK